jgi:hypothetical protein
MTITLLAHNTLEYDFGSKVIATDIAIVVRAWVDGDGTWIA